MKLRRRAFHRNGDEEKHILSSPSTFPPLRGGLKSASVFLSPFHSFSYPRRKKISTPSILMKDIYRDGDTNRVP